MSARTARKPQVGVVMGSQSDWPVVERAVATLREFRVECDVKVLSAHRTPDAVARYASRAERRGLKVIIAAAGNAAHLAGVVAANTLLPVIGVPMKGGALDGLDALLATVQMPAGVPVATVALGEAGAVNAALLAVQVLALGDTGLRQRLAKHKELLKIKVRKGDAAVRAQWRGRQ